MEAQQESTAWIWELNGTNPSIIYDFYDFIDI